MTMHRWNRRRFLRAAGGAALGTSVAASAQAGSAPEVLIIGAGMSGISASYWLRQFGIRALVLEGRDRLGGRIWSSRRWPDAILDMGAAWIHGSATSPLTPLAKQFKIQTVYTDYFSLIMRRPDGVQLTALQLAEVLGQFAAMLGTTAANALQLQARGFPDRPLGTEIDRVLGQMRLAPPVLAGVQAVMDVTLRGAGAEPSDLSLYYHCNDRNIVGVQDLAFPQGYVQLVEKLAAGQQSIPNPVDFQRSRWASDPFALGAYPHIAPGGTPADYDLLSLPVPYAANQTPAANRLFFAGDGTHRQHPMSVYGAYESGMREAQRIRIQRSLR